MAQNDEQQSDDGQNADSPRGVDAVFDALAHESRRLALYYLRDRTSAGLDELATVISGWRRAREHGSEIVTPDEREEVRVSLHHVHLQRLADAGFLQYDPSTGDTTIVEHSEFLDTVLDRSLSDERRKSKRRIPDRDADSESKATQRPAHGHGVDHPMPIPDSRERDESESAEQESLRTFLDSVVEQRQTITLYAPESDNLLGEYFETRDTTVEHEPLPDDGSGGIIVVTTDRAFVGSIPYRAGRELHSPEIRGLDAGPNEMIRQLMRLLDDTTFVSFDRRQLLAASREIEDRAYRHARGTLRAGFQSLSIAQSQQAVYEALITETDLDVHLYGKPDWEPTFPSITAHRKEATMPEKAGTIHGETTPEIGRFWFVIFDSDESQACALLAEESADEPGSFRGFWTYDPELVADLDAYLDATY